MPSIIRDVTNARGETRLGMLDTARLVTRLARLVNVSARLGARL
ncbi:hypothetical protein [Mycetocola saprophilus]